MKKICLFLIAATLLAINAKAQFAIGSPDAPRRGAILDLKSDTLGFLLTRISLTSLTLPNPIPAHIKGMVVYNTTTSVSESLQPGLYFSSGERWLHLYSTASFADSWFYMPTIALDVSTPGPAGPVNLYNEFKKQLNTNTGVVASNGAPTDFALSSIPAATDLYYYVTAYNPDVFENIVINDQGEMTYSVKNNAPDSPFINIVFVEK